MKETGKRISWGLLLAAELSVLGDLICAIAGLRLPAALLPGAFALLAALFLCLPGLGPRRLRRLSLRLLALGLAVLLATGGSLLAFAHAGRYADLEEGKEALYGSRRVLVVAPHQDDELNIAAGVIEGYRRYGSEVYILFVTNGDYAGLQEKRFREALTVAEDLGLDGEHLIFLGYGDGWSGEDGHLYNAPPDLPMTSHIGAAETYGTAAHDCFRPGRTYTRQHLLEDLVAVLRRVRPDVILSTEYETHGDHRATALFLEEALARLIREEPDLRPVLLKTLCYDLAYYGAPDFYSDNIRATQDPYPGDLVEPIHIHSWSERIRLPVAPETLSRSLLGSSTYWQLRAYATQGAVDNARGIISGDRVFWLRDTGSLCLDAEISVSSGRGERLQDLKLLDSEDVMTQAEPFDGTWIPDADDPEREIRVGFDAPVPLREIRLYDAPSLRDNVLDALILLEDGREIHTGPLLPGGGATRVELDGSSVSGFRVRLLETEGDRAGLTELEAYDRLWDHGLSFIKLMNGDGDFVYDYHLDPAGREQLFLYVSGDAPALSAEDYDISCVGEGCAAALEADHITVSCPRGRSCTLTVRSRDGRFADTVRISDPGKLLRQLPQRLEDFLLDCWSRRLPASTGFRMVRGAYRLLRYGSVAAADGG